MQKLEYSYTPEQVRRFPEQAPAVREVDDFITKLDVWTSRKLRELRYEDRSEGGMN